MVVRARPITSHTSRRGLRRVMIGLVVLLLVLALALAGGSWYFSSQLLDVTHNTHSYPDRVLAETGSSIALAANTETDRNGTFGLDWTGGHAILGPVVRISGETVIRRVSGMHMPNAGTRAGIDAYTYSTPAAVHLRYRVVSVPDPLGPMPAWYLTGRLHTWVIIVHGYKSSRSEGVRPMRTLQRLGLPVLDISYRNDSGAPASPDHLYHLGATEWQDLQAGVHYAHAHGARSLVLYSYSMGGNIVESFLHRSPQARLVRAVVLDAPALDWGRVLDLAAQQRHVPGILAAVTKRVVAWRLGLTGLDDINQIQSAGSLTAPTLLFHGEQDTLVPFSGSVAFARARPDLVTFHPVRGADHTQEWNVNPSAYDRVLQQFLRRVLHLEHSAAVASAVG